MKIALPLFKQTNKRNATKIVLRRFLDESALEDKRHKSTLWQLKSSDGSMAAPAENVCFH